MVAATCLNNQAGNLDFEVADLFSDFPPPCGCRSEHFARVASIPGNADQRCAHPSHSWRYLGPTFDSTCRCQQPPVGHQGPEPPSRMLHWVPRVCTDKYEGPRCSNVTMWKGVAAGTLFRTDQFLGIGHMTSVLVFFSPVNDEVFSVLWTVFFPTRKRHWKDIFFKRSGHARNWRTHHSQCEDAHQRSFFGHVSEAPIWASLAQSHSFAGDDTSKEQLLWYYLYLFSDLLAGKRR